MDCNEIKAKYPDLTFGVNLWHFWECIEINSFLYRLVDVWSLIWAVWTGNYREFVAQNYEKVKAEHPDFLFLVRECAHADAVVLARYRNLFYFGFYRLLWVAKLSLAEAFEINRLWNRKKRNSWWANCFTSRKFPFFLSFLGLMQGVFKQSRGCG